MRVTIQKVQYANCIVDNQLVSEINSGYMLLIGFTHDDSIEKVEKACKKIANLRIFEDELGKMNLSIKDVNGSILAISQFTLYGDCNKGNRPSFVNSMNPIDASKLYDEFNKLLRTEYDMVVETGIFGAHMILDPICDGPVTIELEF